MYLAIRDSSILQAGYASLSAAAAELGVWPLEYALNRRGEVVDPHDPWHSNYSLLEKAGEAKAYLREARAPIGVLFVANNFNTRERAAEVEVVVQAVRIATTLGVGVVRLDAALSGTESSSAEERSRAYLSALEAVWQEVGEANVVLACENHGRWGNELGWLEKLIESTEAERLGLTWDPCNLYWSGQPLERVYYWTDKLAHRVAHVHAKSIAYPRDRREEKRPLGWEYGCCASSLEEGDLDFARIFRPLAGVGYSGAVSLEEETLAQYAPGERGEVLRRDLEYLERCWGEADG